ncbi:excinuclease ABC subunit UvrA [Candidatus Peregrinibacteria bacterium CG_4_10_14_0_2_um_filter_38_24]|nr:MAG: excinuclease ABC subunit UvrA [Candidatus Peregrinibacteria bacterium CG_4_10_14_0_2_um_filter_38_24]PJC38932.1 MAG: excinuclease ABC subunit UvrA [Candidatus Peregrinibacteria bacterium CG_4_9_14_0_2_um_filter_38_9]
MPSDKIIIKGARLHNLKNINVEIPRDKFTVITGLSGSGKSSLAFDTIYAEGQRRYVESLSTYARNFLQLMEKPDVDSIEGLSPAISIDQKSAPRNPRSTVGTVTEIYDFLRLLFAKVGTPHCPVCAKPIEKQTPQQIMEEVLSMPEDTKILVLSPIIRDRKGQHIKALDKAKKEGFVRVRVDGEVCSILEVPEMDENKKHNIEIVVDRLVVKDMQKKVQKLSSGQEIDLPNPNRTRLADSIETALRNGEGLVSILNHDTGKEKVYSEHFACPTCQINVPEISPRSFSFNSPHGACEECHGLGTKLEIDPDLLIPNKKLTLGEGAIMPWSATTSHLTWYNKILDKVAKANGFSMNTAVKNLSQKAMDIVLYGDKNRKYTVTIGHVDDKENDDVETTGKFKGEYETSFEGVIPNLERRFLETESEYVRKKIEDYMRILKCPSCLGKRLKPEILAVKIDKFSIIDITEFSVIKAINFFNALSLSPMKQEIARQIFQEVKNRLYFLENVGLAYLTLDRAANTLSGGEAQRIRLATQIGSKLSGVIYVLDEPSIGLHQNDNDKLIKTLISLKELGNTVIVVEHDIDTMLASDFILDIGPGAGKYGGNVVAQGTPEEIMKNPNSLTGRYLSGKAKIEIPSKRRKGNGKSLILSGATEHNLKNVTAKFPLGTFIGVTGVSGSGKSTLINDILVRVVAKNLYGSKAFPGEHKEIKGLEHLDKIINIDQSPIGRTPRSNPATYTGVFTDIRDLFAQTPEAKLRGYKSGRFSFNVKGGRCEACSGDGIKKIEMHFLPDVYVSCETCKGKRYNEEALEVRYRGKNIYEVLTMTAEEALEFFNAIPAVKSKLKTLCEVGLSYIHLGQSATTLSGGEAQRIKLATELSKRSTGKTIYVLDEPTTGLHFDDVRKLLDVLQKLVEKGNTVLVIEHNLDVIKSVDYIIDLGPEGGEGGGEIIAEGTPEEVIKSKISYTGMWLKKIM